MQVLCGIIDYSVFLSQSKQLNRRHFIPTQVFHVYVQTGKKLKDSAILEQIQINR